MNLDYRRDSRTKKQFAEDIKYRTAKEKFLIELYRAHLISLGHKVRVHNYGTDNTGKLQKKATARPDYKLFIDGEAHLIEVKNSPIATKWTFKVHNLKAYVKAGADILIFWDTGYIDKDPKNIRQNYKFGIISCKGIERILHKYKPYKEPKFGNKECVQIPQKDFDKLITYS